LVFGVLNCKSLNSNYKQVLLYLSALAISLLAALPILITLNTAIPAAPRVANPAQQIPSTQAQHRGEEQQALGLLHVLLIYFPIPPLTCSYEEQINIHLFLLLSLL
jgi:hypothetical protein